MTNGKLLMKNKDVAPKTFEKVYGLLVEKEIRKKYSLSNELAILRQRDTKPDEFASYNEYVEQCKAKIKQELEESNV